MSLDQLDLTTITAAILLGSGVVATPAEAAALALECSDESLRAIKARNLAVRDREQHPAPVEGIPRAEPSLVLGKLAPLRAHPNGATEEYAAGWNAARTRLAQSTCSVREVFSTDEFSRGWNAALEAAERQAS